MSDDISEARPAADRFIDVDRIIIAGQMRETHLSLGVDTQLTDFLRGVHGDLYHVRVWDLSV